MERPKRIAFLSEHASPIALLGGADAGGQNVYVDEVSRHFAAHFARIFDCELEEIQELVHMESEILI